MGLQKLIAHRFGNENMTVKFFQQVGPPDLQKRGDR